MRLESTTNTTLARIVPPSISERWNGNAEIVLLSLGLHSSEYFPTPCPASLAPLRFPPAAGPRANALPPYAPAPAASLRPLRALALRTQVHRAPAKSSATSARASGFPHRSESSPA